MERNDYCVILSAMVSQYFKFLSLAILHIIIVFFVCYFLKDVACLLYVLFGLSLSIYQDDTELNDYH